MFASAKRIRPLLLAAVAVALVVAGGMTGCQKKDAKAASSAEQPGGGGGVKGVEPPATFIVKTEVWQPVVSAIGSLRAVNGVNLSTDMAGIVSKISFESGSPVKQGDPLVSMDTQQQEAQLHSSQARLDLAKVDVERKRDLIAKKAIATSDLDTSESELRQAAASVEEIKALIRRKQLTAPFDGVIGIRQVNLGQYVNPGAMIATLQSLDPIYVEFTLSQEALSSVALGKKVRVIASGLPTPFEGEITAINSMVDEATRNVMVQGTLANPEEKLRPGMFSHVEVLLEKQQEVLAIPSSAVSYAPYGNSVYVFRPGADGKKEVQQQFVKLGIAKGDHISVVSGLKAGDEIVASGGEKLRAGL